MTGAAGLGQDCAVHLLHSPPTLTRFVQFGTRESVQQIKFSESDADAQGAVEVDVVALSGYAAKAATAAQERAVAEPEALVTAQD